jgi:PAS domain S-box-containing protein
LLQYQSKDKRLESFWKPFRDAMLTTAMLSSPKERKIGYYVVSHKAIIKHHRRTVKELPLVAAMLALAGTSCAVLLQVLWPVAWAVACGVVICIDIAVMGHFEDDDKPTSSQLLRLELALMALGFVSVCVFLVLPFALLMEGAYYFTVIALALFATAATRSAAMFSMSTRIGVACYAPYLLGLTLALGVDAFRSPANEILGHCVAVVALICCLGYIWMAWLQRHRAELALDTALESSENERDTAARNATVSRLLFQHTTLRAALFDTDSHFIAVNAAWLGAIMKSEEDLIGKTIEEAMPKAKPEWAAAIAAAQEGETTIVDGDATIRADGKHVVLDWHVQPWFNDDGSIGGAVGYAQDVTEVHSARDAAKAKQERLELALKASKSFIWEVDYVAQTVTHDQDAVAFFGHTPTFDSFLGKGDSTDHPDDIPAKKRQALQVLANGGYGRMEHRHMVKGGGIRWVRTDLAPLAFTNGKPSRFVMLTRDVTDEMARQDMLSQMMQRANVALGEKRKLLEELCGETLPSYSPIMPPEASKAKSLSAADDTESTFKQLFAGFDQILTEIDERDMALAAAVQQLRDARTSAEAANIAKSQFLANMSHELRTPLNAIIGYTEILIEDAEYEGRADAAKDATKVRTSATHLLKLINEILDLSKIEAGKMDITREATPLSDVLSDIVSSGEPLAAANNNVIRVEIESDRTLALTDGFRLRQCLLNLVSNACKFTENGTITIGLAITETDENHRWFEISVQDSGIGISAEAIERLFRPFSQADGSTTRKYGGTGLGLALTREMTHLLGGEVFVESEVGVGSKFTLRIPALGLEADDVEMTFAADKTSALVLVVDDDPVARSLTARSANALGMSVASAETGRAAMAFCDENDVGLIVLDLQLPDMDGLDVLAALRGNEKTRNTPVMVVSVDDDRRKSISAGAQEHLAKPCPSAVLTAAMARLARRQDSKTQLNELKTQTNTPTEATHQMILGKTTKRSA